MLDTIELRIKNVLHNKLLLEYLNNGARMTADTYETGELKPMTVKYYTYENSKNTVFVKNDFIVKSSEYKIHYIYNIIKDELKINFSIPKIVYNNNVMMLTLSTYDRNYIGLYDRKDFIRYSLDYSMKVLKQFLRKYLYMVLFTDIIIDQIDISFNEVHKDERNAFEYLKAQQEIIRKYQRKENRYYKNWETSIWFKTERYVWKVYHKGTEYRKSCPKKLHDEHIQRLADKTLRYELSFKSRYLSDIYKDMAGKKDKLIAEHKKRKTAKYDKYINRTLKCYLNLLPGEVVNLTDLMNVDRFPLSDKFLNKLCSIFWNEYEKYKVHAAIYIGDVSKRINEYNIRAKMLGEKQIKPSSLLNAFRWLQSNPNLKSLNMVYSRRQVLNISNNLKLIGVDGLNLLAEHIERPDIESYLVAEIELPYKYFHMKKNWIS